MRQSAVFVASQRLLWLNFCRGPSSISSRIGEGEMNRLSALARLAGQASRKQFTVSGADNSVTTAALVEVLPSFEISDNRMNTLNWDACSQCVYSWRQWSARFMSREAYLLCAHLVDKDTLAIYTLAILTRNSSFTSLPPLLLAICTTYTSSTIWSCKILHKSIWTWNFLFSHL